MKMRKEIKINKVYYLQPLILFLLQGFFSRETNFHFCQFLSSFLKYSSSNFPSFYSYNIFAIYFLSNSPFLKLFSSTKSNFYCFLTSALSLSSNSTTAFFAFFKSFSFSYISFSAVNFFYYTKYFTTPFIFLLFRIFFTSHSLTLFTSTGFTSSIFYPFTCFLYLTT